MVGPRRTGLASFLALLTCASLISACSNDSSSDSGRNVGESQPVTLALDSFNTEELKWSAYAGFFEAIQPAASEPDTTEVADIITAMAETVAPYIGAEPTDQPRLPIAFSSVRNPVDLMNRVIYTDLVKNFGDGRASISRAIDRQEAARYRNDWIRFEEAGDAGNVWTYILSWIHITENSSDPSGDAAEDAVGQAVDDAVIRVVLATNAPGSEITIFPAQPFTAAGGQVVPEARITSFTKTVNESLPAISLNQSWTGKEDLWTWSAHPDEAGRSFGPNDKVKCAHLRVDYNENKAYFFTSGNAAQGNIDNADLDAPADEAPRCGAVYDAAKGEAGAPVQVWELPTGAGTLRSAGFIGY